MQGKQQTQRDPLIGQHFIVRGPDGQPIKAGRIRSRTLDGEYDVTVYMAGGHPRGELASTARMEAERWELYIDEANWRRAYDAATK